MAERKPALPKAAASAKAAAPKAAPRKAPAAKAAATGPSPRRAASRKRAVAPATAAAASVGQTWRRLRRKTKVGVVVSARQRKTVIVEVSRLRKHPLFKKVIRLRKRFATHDEAGEVRAGDLVRIQESRPYSATKRWRVVEVISRVGEAGAAAPRVAEVEKLLEETEGSKEQLEPERKKPEAEEISAP